MTLFCQFHNFFQPFAVDTSTSPRPFHGPKEDSTTTTINDFWISMTHRQEAEKKLVTHPVCKTCLWLTFCLSESLRAVSSSKVALFREMSSAGHSGLVDLRAADTEPSAPINATRGQCHLQQRVLSKQGLPVQSRSCAVRT